MVRQEDSLQLDKRNVITMSSLQRRTWEILEGTIDNDRPAQIWSAFISLLIILNVIAVSFETMKPLASRYGSFFYRFEVFSVVVFSAEYVVRCWSCVAGPEYSRAFVGRLRYACHWLSLVDLFSVLPFYLPFMGLDIRFIRMLRLFRMVRIIKIGRYNRSLSLIAEVVRAKKEELVLSTVIILVLLFLSSSAIYYCERAAQPEHFSSIPDSMWWAVAALTTVGYGDVYPVTTAGKWFAAVISVLGIGIFALPTGILGAGFIERIEARQNKEKVCPHCGKKIAEDPNP